MTDGTKTAASVIFTLLVIFCAVSVLFSLSDCKTPAQISKEKSQAGWECVEGDTWRMRVPQGWIVRHDNSYGSTAVFVPDPDHTWEG